MVPRPLRLATVLVLAGCAATTGSRVSAGGVPATTPAPVSTSGGTVGTAFGGTATIGPGSTVPARGGEATTSTAPPTPTASPGPPTSPPPTAPPPSLAGSGVYGDVSAGPTCPVERAGQPCPPDPVAATVAAVDAGGRAVASTTSGADGRYALALPAGMFTLVTTTPTALPRCPSVRVTVTPGAASRADISCDTGIR